PHKQNPAEKSAGFVSSLRPASCRPFCCSRYASADICRQPKPVRKQTVDDLQAALEIIPRSSYVPLSSLRWRLTPEFPAMRA
ncbi:MAG TPA: hypothetical protein VJS63_04540, partial [Bradyrhizobium sp.]|nr:hypothetical protein [Bradyrhizobium sp.]